MQGSWYDTTLATLNSLHIVWQHLEQIVYFHGSSCGNILSMTSQATLFKGCQWYKRGLWTTGCHIIRSDLRHLSHTKLHQHQIPIRCLVIGIGPVVAILVVKILVNTNKMLDKMFTFHINTLYIIQIGQNRSNSYPIYRLVIQGNYKCIMAIRYHIHV